MTQTADKGGHPEFGFRIESLIGVRCPTCGFWFDDHTAEEIIGCSKASPTASSKAP